MQLSKKQISQLIHIIETTQQILADANRSVTVAADGKGASRSGARRRVGKELVAFKKAIAAERKSGASVAEIARKHGVTPSYIYQL